MQRLMTTTLLMLCTVAGLSLTQDAPSVARAATQDGATIIVDTHVDELIDNGNCTLREAIQAANTDAPVDACPAGGAADTIEIPGGVYELDCAIDAPSALGGLEVMTGTVILQGSVITPTILDGANGCRVLNVYDDVNATLYYLTIRNGAGESIECGLSCPDIPDEIHGGGVRNGGTLTIIGSLIVYNSSGVAGGVYGCCGDLPGGGVYNSGTLSIVRSTIAHNTGGDGAGVYNGGTLSIAKSTVAHNTGQSGAGMYNSATLTIEDSTIAGNETRDRDCSIHSGFVSCRRYEGGGIANAGMLYIRNTTISGNGAGNVTRIYFGYPCNTFCPPPGGGGGILNIGTLVLDNTTIAQNRAGVLLEDPSIRGSGGGIMNRGTLQLQNTLLAGNEGGDGQGTLESLGYNLIESAVGYTLTGDLNGVVLGQSAGVHPLADNGGPTWTHSLGGWSAAINAGNCHDSHGRLITQDQRGEPRPQLGTCDIGAYEAATIDPYDQVWLPTVRLGE